MNFCGKCGTKLTDGFRFCSNCGAEIPVEKHDTFETPSVSSKQYTKQTPNQNSLQATPSAASTLVRSFAKSPLFLAAISTFTLSVLFNLLQISSKINFTFHSLLNFIDNYLEENSFTVEDVHLTLESGFSPYFDMLSARSDHSGVLSSLFAIWCIYLVVFTLLTILTAIGLWITFASAFNKNRLTLSSSGFTMIKIVITLELSFFMLRILMIGSILIGAFRSELSESMITVFICVLEIIFLGSSATDIVKNNSSSSSGSIYGQLILFLILIIVVTILEFFFCIKKAVSVNTANVTLVSGKPSNKVSVFVAVICFLSAGFVFLSVFSAEEATAVISILCSLASSVCFGILILQYRNAMKQLMLEKTDCKS